MNRTPVQVEEERPAWLSGVVKILDSKNTVCGAGFLVNRDLVVTCAHVIENAGSGPDESVKIVFVVDDSTTPYTADVDKSLWRNRTNGDVAFLRELRRVPSMGPGLSVGDGLPVGVAPVELGESVRLRGRKLRGYGFPDKETDGLFTNAEVVGVLRQELQLRSQEISPGYSGGPLVDEERGVVVGMMRAIRPIDEHGRHTETAFANSVEMLRAVCPQLMIRSVPLPSLFQGMEARAGLAERLRTWLDEMIGEPAAFAGRKAEFTQLDTWLNEPHPDAPAALLLWGPGGRGKSSLLARWAIKLQDLRQRHIAFLPISTRHGLSKPEDLLPALTGRLFRLYGRAVPDFHDVKQWCDAITALLHEEPPVPLLLIIDALDEATTAPEPLLPVPSRPARGVRVVASVRCDSEPQQRAWLRALRWDLPQTAVSMPLRTLDGPGCRAVIATALPEIGETDTEALCALAQGDPLALTCYLAEVRNGKQIAELVRVGPQLRRHFDHWFDQQERSTPLCRSLFALLATAREPIFPDDLAAMAPEHRSADSVRLALRSSYRFVREYPNGEHFFSSALYQEFYAQRLTAPEQVAAKERYQQWIKSVLKDLAYARPSPSDYILRQARAHLQDSGDDQALVTLCESPWRHAWLAVDETEVGFLADARRAGQAATELDQRCAELSRRPENTIQPLEWLGHEVRFPLYRAARARLASRPAWLLGALVAEGGMEPGRAIMLAAVASHERVRSYQLATLAKSLPDYAVPELLAYGRELRAPELRAQVLAAVACRGGQESTDLMNEALALIREGANGKDCAEAIGFLVPCLDTQRFTDTLTWLADRFGVVPLASIMHRYPDIQDRIHGSDWKRMKLRVAAGLKALLDEPDVDAELWVEATLLKSAADKLEGSPEAFAFPPPSTWQEAAEDLTALRHGQRPDFMALAREEINRTTKPEARTELWLQAVPLLAADDELGWSEALSALSDAGPEALLLLAPRIQSAPASFWDLLADKVAEMDEYPEGWTQMASGMLLLVPNLPQFHHRRVILKKAVALIQTVRQDHLRAFTYQLVAAFRAAYGEAWPARAKDAAAELRDRWQAADMLFGLANEVPVDRRDCLKQAVAAAAETSHPATIARALAALAIQAGEDRGRLASLAASKARREPDASARVEALVAVLDAVQGDDEARLLNEILDFLPRLPLTPAVYRSWVHLPAVTPANRLADVIQHASGLPPYWHSRIIGVAAGRLPRCIATEAVRGALDLVRESSTDQDVVARAIADVASWCDPQTIAAAIDEVREREMRSSRGFLMAELLPFLGDINRRRRLLDEELSLARLLTRDRAGVIGRLALVPELRNAARWRDEAITAASPDPADANADVDFSANALADLLTIFPTEHREDVAYPALALVGMSYSAAANLVGALAGAIRPIHIPRLHALLADTFAALPESASEVLNVVEKVAPMIGALGGPHAAVSAAAGIEDAWS